MPSLFHPPAVARIAATAAKVIDRSAFAKKITLPRVMIPDPRNIAPYRKQLMRSCEMLDAPKIDPILTDKTTGVKSLALAPTVDVDRPDTWSETLRAGVETGDLKLASWELALGYDYWSYGESRLSKVRERGRVGGLTYDGWTDDGWKWMS